MFNFNCLGGNKTPVCVRVCEPWLGPLNCPHLLWGPVMLQEVQDVVFLQEAEPRSPKSINKRTSSRGEHGAPKALGHDCSCSKTRW